MARSGLTTKAEPRRAGDMERPKPSRQTEGTNRRWLQRIVRRPGHLLGLASRNGMETLAIMSVGRASFESEGLKSISILMRLKARY